MGQYDRKGQQTSQQIKNMRNRHSFHVTVSSHFHSHTFSEDVGTVSGSVMFTQKDVAQAQMQSRCTRAQQIRNHLTGLGLVMHMEKEGTLAASRSCR
jgi:hypothetical protein